MYLPVEDKYTNRKNELFDRLVVIMGGRVAEELVFGDVTNGATGDIRMATGIARKMVCEWGMSERLGMVDTVSTKITFWAAISSLTGLQRSDGTGNRSRS